LYFSSPERRSDPRNHCVPILDHFTRSPDNQAESEEYFIVMPVLRPFDSPSFSTVSEAVDFVRQALEGLAYLHENDTAHRDYCALNIMMDPSRLFPDGFHPSSPDLNRQGLALAKHLQRSDVGSIVYYVIDFGLSTRFVNRGSPRLVRGIDCQDKEVPDLSQWTPYDPFPVDIFTLGNVVKKRLLEQYSNLMFLEPLVREMTKMEPGERPTISEATALFEGLVQNLRPSELRWCLHLVKDSSLRKLWTNIKFVTGSHKSYIS